MMTDLARLLGLLLAGGTDVGEVGDDLLGVLSFTGSGLTTAGGRGEEESAVPAAHQHVLHVQWLFICH